MPRFNRFAAATAVAAALSLLAAAPASARDRHHGRHHDDGIDGGDILAGVLILGGIAAVAGALDKDDERDDAYRYPEPPPPDQGYDYRDYPREGASTGLGRAAEICVDAIERTIDPVGSVDGVRRGAEGWDVDGTLADGSPFACSIGPAGEIEDIRVNRAYSGAAYDGEPAYDAPQYDEEPTYDDPSYDDTQWDDEDYARARAELDQGD